MANVKTQAKPQATKEETLKKIGVIAFIVIVVGLMIFVQVYNRLADSGYYMRKEVAAETENYKVDGAMMTYFYSIQRNQYAGYEQYLGIDTSKSLKDQANPFGTGSWFDYYMTAARNYVAQCLELCEIAKEKGITLDADNKAAIDDSLASLKTSAKNAGYSNVKHYLFASTGAHLNEKDIRNCLEITALASKAYDAVDAEISFTKEDYANYYSENNLSFDGVDVLKYTVSAETFETYDEEGNVTNEDDAIATATSYADKLTGATSEAEFKSIVEEIVLATGEDESEAAEASEHTLITHALMTDSSIESISGWAFATAKAGETFKSASEDGKDIEVFYLIKEAYRDETVTRNVRHILLATNTYGDAEAARAKAEEVYALWGQSGYTNDSFTTLCAEYSDDSADGTYTDIKPGDMVTEFDAWLFDSSRNVGDTGIVDTTYGSHIMFYTGEGELSVWETEAENSLRTSRHEEILDGYADRIVYYYDVIESLG